MSHQYSGEPVSEFSTITMWIKHAGKSKLLTPPEEYALLLRYKESESVLSLLRQITIVDSKLSEDEGYRSLVSACLNEQRKIKTELFNKNLKLIIKEAKKYIGRGLPLEDLIQEGSTGLMRAIEKFELERGNKLSTYAVRWIQQRIGRALENKSRLVKIPANILGQINELKRKYKDFTENESRPPTAEEIAEILNITVDRAKELGRLLYTHVSLDETVGEDENLSMVNYVVDAYAISPEERAEHKADKEYIFSLLDQIDDESVKFIKLKYGFFDNKERTDKEMAQLLNKPLKEIKEKDTNILLRLKQLGSVEMVNTSINCNLILESFGPDIDRVTEYLIGKTNLTKLRLIKTVLPAPILFEVTQHIAKQHKKELESFGAKCAIITV